VAHEKILELSGGIVLRLTHNLTSVEENWVHAKKKTYGYLERDESKRQTLIEELANQVNEMIVYVDEAGMDNPWRLRLWPEWERTTVLFYALKPGRRLSSSEYDCSPL
jgi:hypothetical protein